MKIFFSCAIGLAIFYSANACAGGLEGPAGPTPPPRPTPAPTTAPTVRPSTPPSPPSTTFSTPPSTTPSTPSQQNDQDLCRKVTCNFDGGIVTETL